MHPNHSVNENANLGVWLVEFFDLYGRKFDYNGTCISILNDGQYFPKRNLHNFTLDKMPSDLLCIEDPFLPGQNSYRPPVGTTHIKYAFEYAYNKLSTTISTANKDGSAKKCSQQCILGSFIHITDDIIKFRNFIRNNFEHEASSDNPRKQ